MLPSELAQMSLEDICELYASGSFPADLTHLTLGDIVNIADQEDQQNDSEDRNRAGVSASSTSRDELLASSSDSQNKENKKFMWREEHPNSNNTNVPLLLWRGDENNDATLALAFGLYEEEFNDLENNELLEVKVTSSDGNAVFEKISVDLDFPKDEKLSRKTSGLAGSGSEFLCTYCNASRNTVMDPPFYGDASVSLTNNLLKEAAHYCLLNPEKKSQAQLSKISLGTKQMPICSTDPGKERPDALHLDINVTKQLVTIASRLFHHKQSGQPLKYNKTEVDKKEMESSEALYHKKLRERIATLPELTQNPGNFAREFCDENNAEFIRQPLPDIPDTETWNDLMKFWRNMRSVHKRKEDPTDDDIELFKSWVIEFQEKFSSLKWVPAANQIHRLSHLAFFMQSRPIKSIGAYSLEGLEHGNFSTKDGELRRVWKGNTKESNKQLFQLLRLQSSPTLRNVVKQLEVDGRKEMKCTKCGVSGHKRTSKKCSLYGLESVSTELDESEVASGGEWSSAAELDESEVASGGEWSSDEESLEVTTVVVDEDEECAIS